MFTIKNAVKNIYRYKSTYISFGVLYFILILAASVCVTIFVYTGQLTNNFFREYANIAILGTTSRTFDDPRLSKDEFLQLKYTEHFFDMQFFRYNFSTHWVQEDIEITVEVRIDGDVRPLVIDWDEWGREVFVLGYNMSLIHLAIEHFDIERGRMFENGSEAVIAKNSVSRWDTYIWDYSSDTWIEYRTWIDLDLGDKIVFRNEDRIIKEFTVVGILTEMPENDEDTNARIIYTTLESAEYFDAFAFDYFRNLRTAPIGLAFPSQRNAVFDSNPLKGVISSGYDVFVYLYLPENFDDINQELAGMNMEIVPWFANFYIVRQLIWNMQGWSIIFMVLTGFIIIVVTIVITIILLNSRKYEIAVLRSVGMKKSRIMAGYLVEKLAFIWGIALVSLVAAQFIAPLFTARTFEGMRELMSPETFASVTSGGGVALILQNAGLVFGGATAVVALSLVIACINIVRFEPLKIFNNQY